MTQDPPRSNLELIRFPLIFTVWSDVLMGCFLAAAASGVTLVWSQVALLLTVTTLVYTGGMTLRDCSEYESDREHGHRQTLPAGVLSVHGAYAIGILMVLLAVGGATLLSASAGLLSVLVALLLLGFASWTRGLPFLGSMNVALLRGTTVVMGMAFAGAGGPVVSTLEHWGPPAAVFAYVFLATRIGAEQAHPRREGVLRLTGALIVLLVVLHALVYVSPLSKARFTDGLVLSVFVLGVVVRLVQLARRAVARPSAESVGKLEVGALVAIIVLNAGLTAMAGTLVPTLGVLFLLLPTVVLLRFFHLLFPGTRSAID
ncbi:MAG TPA: UbiA family prenyltransferase [Planctomycetota bacterium]|nr:UbiA family prenyltransferase [Planctomycetota bacterium]